VNDAEETTFLEIKRGVELIKKPGAVHELPVPKTARENHFRLPRRSGATSDLRPGAERQREILGHLHDLEPKQFSAAGAVLQSRGSDTEKNHLPTGI